MCLTFFLSFFCFSAWKVSSAVVYNATQVTTLETVFANGPDKAYSCVLSEHLMCFCGVLAAGTRCGHIYLIGKCTTCPLAYQSVTDHIAALESFM